MTGNDPGRPLDEAEIRLPLLGERGGNADRDRVALCKAREVAGRRESSGRHVIGEVLVGHRIDVGAARLELLDLHAVDVEADDAEARTHRRCGQGQADIAKADHPDRRRASFYPGKQRRCPYLIFRYGHFFPHLQGICGSATEAGAGAAVRMCPRFEQTKRSDDLSGPSCNTHASAECPEIILVACEIIDIDTEITL
jgi:hypothetical protein